MANADAVAAIVAVSEGVPRDGLGHDPAVVHGVHRMVAAPAVTGVVLHAQDLGVADEAAQGQIPLLHSLLYPLIDPVNIILSLI